MLALDHAAGFLGQEALAAVIGIGARQLRQKIAAERPIHDHELRLAAEAVAARAREAAVLAERLTSLITEQEDS